MRHAGKEPPRKAPRHRPKACEALAPSASAVPVLYGAVAKIVSRSCAVSEMKGGFDLGFSGIPAEVELHATSPLRSPGAALRGMLTDDWTCGLYRNDANHEKSECMTHRSR